MDRPSPTDTSMPAPPRRFTGAERRRQILDVAARAFATAGFAGTTTRSIATECGISEAALYKYFRSKEDILLFALSEEAQKLEDDVRARPPRGPGAARRVGDFFSRATRGLTRKPDFARAVLRAIAAGDPEMSAKVAGFHLRMMRLIVAALRGEPPEDGGDLARPVGSREEQAVAMVLNHVWFAALVGWSGGLHPVRTVGERVSESAAMLLGGA